MMQTVRWIVAATVFVALLLLSLQNSKPVELAFFNIATWQAPLIVVVFVTFAIGVALGLLAGALRASRLKRQLNRLRREQRSTDSKGMATAAPGMTPASGPGFTRNDRVPDGL